MIGIGLPIYNETIKKHTEETPDMYNVVCDLIRSIEQFTDQEYLLIIRDNDSLDYRFQKFSVTIKKYFPHLNTKFISDPRKSLTDGWNDMVRISLEAGCDAVILTNQDVIVTKYWSNFVRAVQVQSNDIIVPMMSEACYQPLQKISEEDFHPINKLALVHVIQGCCFGASRKAFEENMFDSKNYFDPQFEFGYNEIEWQQRNNEIGGRSLILLNSFVIHMEEYSWAEHHSTKRVSRDFGRERLDVLGQIDYQTYIQG